MVGVSESYLGALAVELGHDDTEIAMLATVPLVIGAVAQLSSPALQRMVGSRRRFVVAGAMLQALLHLGLFAIAMHGERAFAALLIVKSAYWAAGMSINPAWNVWIGAVTETIDRNRWLARRTGIVSAALLAAYLGAGGLLQLGTSMGLGLGAFAGLHGVALVARIVSALLFAGHADVPLPARERGDTRRRMRSALRSARGGTIGLQVAFMFGAGVAIPLFAPYMLRVMGMSLGAYAVLTGIAMLAKALLTPVAGRYVARVGLRPALLSSMLAISAIAAIWTATSNYLVLCLAQVISGVAWSVVELTLMQLLLDEAEPDARTERFAVSASLTSVALLFGGLVGARVVAIAGTYHAAFALSSALRALPVLIVLRLRIVPVAALRRVFFRPVSARVDGGQVRVPIVTDLEAPSQPDDGP